MFATDKNIESISKLIESFKRYLSLEARLWKIVGIEKAVRLSTLLLLLVAFFVMLIFAFMFLSAAAVFSIEPYIGIVGALLVVAAAHLLLFVLLILLRKPLIERPLIRLLTSIIG